MQICDVLVAVVVVVVYAPNCFYSTNLFLASEVFKIPFRLNFEFPTDFIVQEVFLPAVRALPVLLL